IEEKGGRNLYAFLRNRTPNGFDAFGREDDGDIDIKPPIVLPPDFDPGDWNNWSDPRRFPLPLPPLPPLPPFNGGLRGRTCFCGEGLNVWGETSWSEAWEAAALATQASQQAAALFPPGTGNNDAHDAVRHCIWACEMTKAFGAYDAATVLNNHEDCVENDPCEHAMDNHNNQVGVQLGENNPPSCASACMKASQDGRLQNGFRCPGHLQAPRYTQ
ncbi:MAG: DUF6973 domain-containing protein, partial [Armatimonadota bacterium]